MSDFLQLAQSLTLALKALQMYTAAHPRAQEALAASHTLLAGWLATQDRLQVSVSGNKAFVDGIVQDARSPQVVALIRAVSERGVSGFLFERGVTLEEHLAFLQGLGTKPQKLEEVGGFEAFLKAAGVQRIKISQTRYQEVAEGETDGGSPQAPAFSPAAPASPATPGQNPLVKLIREALLASIAKPGQGSGSGGLGTGLGHSSGSHRAYGAGGGTDPGLAPALANDGSPGAPPRLTPDGDQLAFLGGFQGADLSGLGPLGDRLGLGEGMPTPVQLATLRQVLMSLEPDVQLSLLAGMGTLPERPAGLALGVKALAGEILSVSVSSMLARGAGWSQLRGPLEDILRPLPERGALVRALAAHLRGSGQDGSQAELLLRRLDWEALSVEGKLLKIMEEGHLFELSLDQRLAFLRELLELIRYQDFLRVLEVLLEALRNDRAALRLQAAQTLAGITHWIHDPGLPPGAEGPLADALRAHFAWEPDPPIHRSTAEGLEALVTALLQRGELGHVITELRELEGLCAFLEEQHPWRNQALSDLRSSLERPERLGVVTEHIFHPDREWVIQEVYPYLEFLGDPLTRHLVDCLGGENDRARRGRLVEAVRNLGPLSLPPLIEALASPAWYLVRNALALLSDLGDAGCLPAIVPLLRHPEPRVRRAAVRALWKLGGPVSEPHLVARMKDTDAETLQEILFALGQLRSEASVATIAELAQDKRVPERLRIQTLTTLEHIASPRSLPVLVELLRRRGIFGTAEASPIRLAAAQALAAIQTPESREALRRIVDAEPRGEDRLALQRLLDPPVAP